MGSADLGSAGRFVVLVVTAALLSSGLSVPVDQAAATPPTSAGIVVRLASGSFGRDDAGRRYDDLVATAYDSKNVNLVEVIDGSAGGLSPKHSRGWDLDSCGVRGR